MVGDRFSALYKKVWGGGFGNHPHKISRGITFFLLYQQSPHPTMFYHSFSPSPLLPSSSSLVFVQRDWLLSLAPGAETLANSVALHCVG